MTLVQSLLNGNKILCCGNGTSAANAQHFAASMINRFETERPGLPAIALNTDNVVLTAIANDRLHDEIYAKQVRALGHAAVASRPATMFPNSPRWWSRVVISAPISHR